MEVEDTFIEGLKILHLKKFADARGSFLKVFNFDLFQQNGLNTQFKENYFSVSKKGVIRGMHFQLPNFEHDKLVYLNCGKILDVVIDIRKESKTYGNYFSIEITEDKPVAVYIPIGCAHGFLSLEENSMVSYLQTTVYNASCDGGIRFDSFGMDWNIEKPILSDRDFSFSTFADFNSPF